MREIRGFDECVSDDVSLVLRTKEEQVFSQVTSSVTCIRSSFPSHRMASMGCNKYSI